MARKYLEIVGTPAVLAAQARWYGRARPVNAPQAGDPLGAAEAAFIAERDSFYLASVGESGWPYVQHRGGAPGFLRVLGPTTLAFADYEGNRQMISAGNLAADGRVSLFLMDYANRRRLKVLGHARLEAAAARPDLVARLVDADVPAPVARLVVVEVLSFDWNCPQYITPRYTAEQVATVVEPLQRRIAALEARLARAGAKETGHV